ncbi:hypothetical protein PTKU46_80350 [Paraburkholderia terrae]
MPSIISEGPTNYTTLSRSAQELKVRLPALRSGEPLHLVVGSTGVMVYGEGEWVRKHGYSKRPHLAQGATWDWMSRPARYVLR